MLGYITLFSDFTMGDDDDVAAENLFMFFGATYNQLVDLLVIAVSNQALKHEKAGGETDAKKALSKILKNNVTAFKKINSTSYARNRGLLFDEKEALRSSIDICQLDCKLLLDILLMFPGFLKADHLKGFKCTHNVDKCCDNCNHATGSKNCRNCEISKTDCKKYKVCVGSCQTCFKCNKDRFKELIEDKSKQLNPSEHLCTFFMFYYCLKIMQDLRNGLFAHITKALCEEFLDKKIKLTLADFSFDNEEKLKDFIRIIFHLMWKHMEDNLNVTVEEKNVFLEKVDSICTGIQNFFEHKKAIKKLSIIYFTNVYYRSYSLPHTKIKSWSSEIKTKFLSFGDVTLCGKI